MINQFSTAKVDFYHLSRLYFIFYYITLLLPYISKL